jgi:hypothetical protein
MPRSATIVCVDQHTDFAVLNKATYRRVMGKATQKKVEVMITFLKNFRIFQKMSESSLQQLNYYMKEQKFINRGSVLFK